MFEPVIKWSGSKRSQAERIVSLFPDCINTYYEPFVGGGSIFRQLLDSDKKVNRVVCSDLNRDLIELWKLVAKQPDDIADHYEKLWKELNKDEDLERKKKFFFSIRERLNEKHDPKDFMFIMRTCTNGMPRYNSEGAFNNSFHVTRPGIDPSRFYSVLLDWYRAISKKDVEFICRSYEAVKPECEDFVYMDPPYAGTNGMYFGGIDLGRFFSYVENLQCEWALSFAGKVNNENLSYPVPEKLFTRHIYLKSGNSSFRRVVGTSKDAVVYESLYLSYDFERASALDKFCE